jgi:NADH-quinone oxidoreductase subunit N
MAAFALSILLFSLAGIPPTAGFFGKFYLFKVAVDHQLLGLVIVALLNSMVSAYYYLRIMVAMYMQEGEGVPGPAIKPSVAIAFAVAICLFFVLSMGLYPSPYIDAAKASVAALF